MKIKSLLKFAGISIGLLTLAACSSTGTQFGSQASSLSSSGLGSQGTIRGMNVSNAVLLRAPYNQSYYFNFNKSTVCSKYYASINAQANYLIRHSRASVLLAGNTDARGSHEYNIALGERRAMAVAYRLEMAGVSKKQIRVISYGDMKPIALGHTPQAYAKNRRVDLIYENK